jgi:nucleotide-binding universal stress UspA family protein
MQNIVVAIDSSAAGSHAVDIAAKLAKAFDGKSLIVTVADNLTRKNIRELFRSHRDFGEAPESHSTQILAEAEKCPEHLGVTNIQLQVVWGDPARSIMEIAGGKPSM